MRRERKFNTRKLQWVHILPPERRVHRATGRARHYAVLTVHNDQTQGSRVSKDREVVRGGGVCVPVLPTILEGFIQLDKLVERERQVSA